MSNRFGEDENRFGFCRRTSESGRNPKNAKWKHFESLPLAELVAVCEGTTDERTNSILGAFDSNGTITEPQRRALIMHCVNNVEWDDE